MLVTEILENSQLEVDNKCCKPTCRWLKTCPPPLWANSSPLPIIVQTSLNYTCFPKSTATHLMYLRVSVLFIALLTCNSNVWMWDLSHSFRFRIWSTDTMNPCFHKIVLLMLSITEAYITIRLPSVLSLLYRWNVFTNIPLSGSVECQPVAIVVHLHDFYLLRLI